MKKLWRPLVTLVGALVLLIITAVPVAAQECPPCPCPCNFEGCTPGFWKNHTDVWSVYSPGQSLESVFDVPDSFGLDSMTLLQALSFKGGPDAAGMARNLLRQAVAALLNAAHPDINYPVSTADIISWTNGAMATLNRDTMETQKNWFDQFNNLGCDDF